MAAVYRFGEFELDLGQRMLYRAGRPVPLTPKAIEILVVLVERNGAIVGRSELMDRVWPDTFVEEGNLTKHISMLRLALEEASSPGRYIETLARRGYRFCAPVTADRTPSRIEVCRVAPDGPGEMRHEPVGGAVTLESCLYIARPADGELREAIGRGDSIILIKGPRQIGKTSLLARGLQHARERAARVVMTNFEDLSASDFSSSESLFLALGALLSDELEIASPRSVWDPDDSAVINFGRYVRRIVLAGDGRVVWGLDEVDRLFTCPFGAEVFGLFRSWHNKRSLDPAGPWHALSLVIAYATEAHLFISDPNRSPFNVGTDLPLEDFTYDQVAELNARHDGPLRTASEIARLHALLGGHPYLTRKSLRVLADGGDFEVFERTASTDEGPLGAHLRRMLVMLRKDEALLSAVRSLLVDAVAPSPESFYRLRTAGVLSGDSARSARLRCEIYARYLGGHLA